MENKETYLFDDVLEFFIKAFPIQAFVMVRALRKTLQKIPKDSIIERGLK